MNIEESKIAVNAFNHRIWPIVAEKSDDGSWSVYFKDSPDIIAGSNDSLEDALVSLAEIVNDDLQDSRENKDNISLYQAKRHQFLKKVFNAF